MIVRPSPFEDDVRRLEALYHLASLLEGRLPPDISHRYSRRLTGGFPELRFSTSAAADELAVSTVWFLGPHRNDFSPFPTDGKRAYKVLQLHWRDEPEGKSYAWEEIAPGDEDVVVSSIQAWRHRGPRDWRQNRAPHRRGGDTTAAHTGHSGCDSSCDCVRG